MEKCVKGPTVGIEHGYQLPFITLLVPLIRANHVSAVESAQFVQSALDELITSDRFFECSECSTVCSPLQVVTNGLGKQVSHRPHVCTLTFIAFWVSLDSFISDELCKLKENI